jgi:hypothetical protein
MIERNGFLLSSIINRPDLHKELLGNYTGAYSLGITSSDRGTDDVLLLRVEPENTAGFANEVTFEGHKIAVIVKGSFRKPRALRRSAR